MTMSTDETVNGKAVIRASGQDARHSRTPAMTVVQYSVPALPRPDSLGQPVEAVAFPSPAR